jgi:LPXTG-site transpeptidase (sortase) family protein
MILAGFITLAAVGSYYGYGIYARSQLQGLTYSVETETSLVPLTTVAASSPKRLSEAVEVSAVGVVHPDVTLAPAVPTDSAPTGADSVASSAGGDPGRLLSAFPEVSYASIYPGVRLHPKYWANPLWAGTDEFTYSYGVAPKLPDGFRAMSASEVLAPHLGSKTTRITVPSIGVESDIKELEIVNLGDSRAYETPKNAVGHIPESSNPGESGNGWFFGHLESPIKGEGNVFQRLPDIPEQLRNGDDVYVTLENEEGHVFLYKVTATDVVHQDDMRLYDTDGASITLVACVPRLVYDHRILVTADLVGIND